VLAPSVAKVNAVLQLANEQPLRPFTITNRLGEGWLHNKTVSALRTLERIGIARPVQRQRHTEYEPNPESPYADVAHRLNGTMAADKAVILKGVHILRTHDLRAAEEAGRVADALVATG